ncbi:MAG: polysaccharide deacetylase family protein [Paludibacter sp.]|nr:polysaccharide deacetylase family protein [Paludibacter sp.]
MAGMKSLLSNILSYSPLRVLLHLRSNTKIIVCNYHRLYEGKRNTDFDDGVFAHSVKTFEKHLEWLKKNTKILSEAELLALIKSGTAIPKMCSMVTFDDGYIDNYTLAYPLLKRLNVPAIYFIPTSPINTRCLGWWDIISYIIKKTTKTSFCYNDEVYTLEQPNVVIRRFQKLFMEKPFQETSALLDTLSDLCGVPLPDIQTQSNELMTWDQIREVSQNGIDIGSHSDSHIVLNTLSSDEQKKEMVVSKSIIENKIDKSVRTFAYPVGGYQHFSQHSMELVSECGYGAAFSFNTGINDTRMLTACDIKRIEPPELNTYLVSLAAFPKVFSDI